MLTPSDDLLSTFRHGMLSALFSLMEDNEKRTVVKKYKHSSMRVLGPYKGIFKPFVDHRSLKKLLGGSTQ